MKNIDDQLTATVRKLQAMAYLLAGNTATSRIAPFGFLISDSMMRIIPGMSIMRMFSLSRLIMIRHEMLNNIDILWGMIHD